jgi:hypothetical protein
MRMLHSVYFSQMRTSPPLWNPSSNDLFVNTTELNVESNYSSLMTSQQCVTSLMYLLDAMGWTCKSF